MKKMKKSYNLSKTNQLKQSIIANYFNIFNNIFVYKNLDDTLKIPYFNEFLFFNGSACFTKIDNQLLSVGYSQGGNKNLYQEDINGIAVYYGGTLPQRDNLTTLDKENKNTVILYDNYFKIAPYSQIENFIDKMVNLYRLQDTLIFQAKKPCIISVDESNVNNVLNFFDEVESNKPFIIGSNPLGKIKEMEILPIPNNLQSLKTINEEITYLDNVIKQYLGLCSNENIDKKERLVVDEINSNNISNNLILLNKLKIREEFIDNVNFLFNKKFKVELNEEITGVGSSAISNISTTTPRI